MRSGIRWLTHPTGGDIIDDLNDAGDKKKWRGILGDPPWQWDSAGGLRGATTHYPTMPLDEIRALPVSQIAYDDAFLFLWVPPSLFQECGLLMLEAWGLAFKMNIVWDKMAAYGRGALRERPFMEDLLIGDSSCDPNSFPR